jgi:hypothetical protein
MELYLADATLYLELFSIVTIAWQWLLQALRAIEAQGACRDCRPPGGKPRRPHRQDETGVVRVAGMNREHCQT